MLLFRRTIRLKVVITEITGLNLLLQFLAPKHRLN